ncbi:MAG: type I restriction enzyme HsdR N-terminal domain-containing protein [Chitinophagaceae bacterium]
MIRVAYPEPRFRIKDEAQRKLIFCTIRKRWLVLTEEEWVRQNFVRYLVGVLLYPASLIALEKEVDLNGLKKRFDILVYNHKHEPWMLIECKEPAVSINENVLQQVLRYNITVPATYLVITNGNATAAWKSAGGQLVQLTQLPEWTDKL